MCQLPQRQLLVVEAKTPGAVCYAAGKPRATLLDLDHRDRIREVAVLSGPSVAYRKVGCHCGLRVYQRRRRAQQRHQKKEAFLRGLVRVLARQTGSTSPIRRMGTSVADGWRESSRPELWAVC